jgi:hypothetical protein
LQKLSLGNNHAERDFRKSTAGVLLFSQGDNYFGKPTDVFRVGQPLTGQASYRGWILTGGPGKSEKGLERLKALAKENGYKPDLYKKASNK